MEDINSNSPSVIDRLKSITRETRQILVEWKEGISFTLKYIPRPALSKLYESAHELKRDPQQPQQGRQRVLNSDKFNASLCDACIVDWHDVTYRKLANVLPIKLDEIKKDEQDVNLPYDRAAMLLLFKEAYELDQWVQGFCAEISNFAPEQEEELKN